MEYVLILESEEGISATLPTPTILSTGKMQSDYFVERNKHSNAGNLRLWSHILKTDHEDKAINSIKNC